MPMPSLMDGCGRTQGMLCYPASPSTHNDPNIRRFISVERCVISYRIVSYLSLYCSHTLRAHIIAPARHHLRRRPLLELNLFLCC